MTLADLAGHLTRESDGKTWWRLVWEFLEEYKWEPADVRLSLLRDEPSPTGDERWDTLLAALAGHLAAEHDLAAPGWADPRVLARYEGSGVPSRRAVTRARMPRVARKLASGMTGKIPVPRYCGAMRLQS
jgi:hypothetical protein